MLRPLTPEQGPQGRELAMQRHVFIHRTDATQRSLQGHLHLVTYLRSFQNDKARTGTSPLATMQTSSQTGTRRVYTSDHQTWYYINMEDKPAFLLLTKNNYHAQHNQFRNCYRPLNSQPLATRSRWQKSQAKSSQVTQVTLRRFALR